MSEKAEPRASRGKRAKATPPVEREEDPEAEAAFSTGTFVPAPEPNGNGNGDVDDGGRHPSAPGPIAKLMPGLGDGMESLDLEEYDARRDLLDPGGDDPRVIDARTEVNALQIIQISRGRAFARYYDVPILDHFINDILRLSFSKDRKSRKEFVEASRASAQGLDDGRYGMAGLLAGKLRG